MKKLFVVFFTLCVCVNFSFAQKALTKATGKDGGTGGAMTGGVGMTKIDGDLYYLIGLQPEIAFGKFGAGLDLNFYVSSKDQSVRWGELQRGRFIRYLRWGTKGSDTYIRVGALDYSQLGHGFILYKYKNSASVDARKIGVEFDLDFTQFGFETVYSDVTDAGVVGTRGYVRPLQLTPLGKVPVIGNLEVGATFAMDLRKDSKDTRYLGVGVDKQNNGTLGIFGIDLGLPLLRLGVFNATVYYDFAKIAGYGSGMAAGLDMDFSLFGLATMFTKFERRFAQTGNFMPGYFDSFYEIERYQTKKINGVDSLVNKFNLLTTTADPGPGYYGSLTIDVLGTIQVNGAYQKLDVQPKSGRLHLWANTGDKIPMITASAGYDRINIDNNSDMFKIDERSLMYAEVGYKLYPFMTITMVYTWTFTPNLATGGFETQERITPKVGFVFPF